MPKNLGSKPKPLYQKVKAYIREQIDDDRWRADQRIPSENELVKTLGASRMTVHRALRELTHEGLLIRIQGVGTFVAKQKPQSAQMEVISNAFLSPDRAIEVRMKKTVTIDAKDIGLQELVAVARYGARVGLSSNARDALKRTGGLIAKWLKQNRTIYGVTTGFGALSDVTISRRDAHRLQENILLSHAAGVGPALDEAAARGVMLLRIKELALGHACGRLSSVQRLIQLLNRGVHPVIPEQGSVGASGDLCPLAHMALLLIGKGEGYCNGRRLAGAQILKQLNLKPLRLAPGEGLALINGTQVMTAIGALAVYDALRLCKIIDIAAAMSLEVLMGSRTEFDPRIHRIRPHPGQAVAADNMLRLVKSSEIITSHKDCKRIQDAYTLRCSPQVHGASHDAIHYARQVIETEMNSATNNPLVFSDTDEVLLGGNFHGQPVALALDFMAMAVSELANIAERRIERLVNPKLSGLPAFLVQDGGLNSGFMIAQYTAAALVSENKVLAHPASVDSIPTSANKEDHVSMGTIAARKCRNIVANAQNVAAIELLCAAQGLDLFTNLKPGKGTMAAYRTIRQHVPFLEKDRLIADDIATVRALIHSGDIL
ncbi:MAG: histidine ammonia-lyase, partial [Desulfobacteraceae bacterium]